MPTNAPKGMFPLGQGRFPYREAERLECPKSGGMYIRSCLRAIATGEFRIPKKGELFLSGAIIEAYYADEDYVVTKYFIAKLVRTRLIKYRIIVQE